MLESIYKKSSHFLEQCIAIFISILKIIIRSRFGLTLPQSTERTCAILGNGPSLNTSFKEHLSFIKSADIICVNNFNQAPEFFELKPTKYVLLDNLFFAYHPEHLPHTVIEKTLHAFKPVDWSIDVYVPYSGKHSFFVQHLQKENPHIRFIYYNYVIAKGFNWFTHWVFRNNLGSMQCQNVLAMSIFLSINSGYRNIFLFGADHSWHEQYQIENNKVLLHDQHFYDKTPKKPIIMHDHVKNEKRTIADMFLSLHKAFKGYERINDYAISRQVKIWNASAKSYIDTFDRVELSDTIPQT